MPIYLEDPRPIKRKARLEFPLLLSLFLPIVLLHLGIAALWAEHLGQSRLNEQAVILTQQAVTAFSTPESWRSEPAFTQALSHLRWRQAYLQDAQGARVWQQDRLMPPPAWPRPAPLTLRLDPEIQLVIAPPPLAPKLQDQLHRQALLVFTLALGAGLALSCALYLFAQRRLALTLAWAERLESGQLSDLPPFRNGISGAIAKTLQVLAQRLRFSHDALQQHNDYSRRRSEARLAALTAGRDAHKKTIEKLQQMLASRSEFMSGMSHELRTPLTAIVGFSDLLEKTELSSEQAEFVQTIRKSAKGLVGMISDLLDMERIEAGRLDLHEVGFDIHDILEDTISLLAPLAYSKHLELISLVFHDVPSRLRGDPTRVQQILTNLISNAIKFTERGQVLIRVSRQPDEQDRIWLKFQVEDSGPGLNQEQLSQLFTAFQRFERTGEKRITGSGLGLHIVKKLTDLLQGRIEVESEPGVGSIFSACLPFAPHAQQPHKADWDILRNTRCWVLEQHDLAWLSLQHLLEFWEVETRRFSSATKLWQTLKGAKPQKLPDFVLLGLRADEATEQSIADILSLQLDPPLAIGCLINSVDGHLHKHLKDRGAHTVLPKCSNRASLYRSCCELLNPDPANVLAGQALKSRQVMVAEDNPASRHYLKALLASLGAQVIVAENGQEAVKLWESEKPEFVLLDLHMPKMDGEQASLAIREADPAGATVMIGMSAYVSPEEERAWQDNGFNAILTKPFDEHQLLRCLHPWLQRPAHSARLEKPSPAAQLVKDPELARMMLEELPKQLRDLDQAFIQGELLSARSAAHQLHGTAAFFHLDPLKTHVFLMEKRLKEVDSIARHPRLRDDMANVSSAVEAIVTRLSAQTRAS